VHLWHADLGTAAVPWLADHQTHRVAVLPAAVCAELALAAGAAGLGAGPRAPVVRHLQLPALLPLSAATEVTTRLTVTGPGEGTVELLARDDLGRWTRYGTARVATTPDPATPDPATPGHAAPVVPDTSDWAEVDLPRVLERDGRRCGAGLRALTGARAAGDTVLAGVALPAEAEPATLFRLHPALAEAALQSVIIAAGPGRDDRPADRRAWLVVAVGSIRVPGDPARARHCLARLSGPDTGSAWLLDGDGAVLAELADVRLRRVPAWAVPVPLADKVFERCWVPVPARERSAAQPEPGTWVLLGGSTPDDAECALAEQLRGRGATVLRADRDDPDAVAGMLGAGAHGVVLLTEPEPAGEPTGADLRRAQAAVAAVLSAVRAVTTGVTGEVGHPRLWVLTGAAAGVTAGERPSPLWYALRAMIRVLAFEDPELRATLVDLDSPLDSVGDAPVAAAVAAELGADTVPGEPVEDELALRGGQRWAGRMVPASVPRPGAGVPLARDGGYVITGGLGGLGLLLAGRLAEAGATRVVLSGRGAPGPDARRALARMRASGTELVVINGDIGEPDTASALVAAATRGGLPLRGVAHAAAVLRDAVATGVTAADLRQVWWPKADGGLHLHRATLGHPLDWWLTFSSAAGFVGSPGQSAYATANAWLDGLAAWRRHAGLPATTVNWGAWAETGGADGTANPVLEPVGAAEGMLALQAVLESGRAATTVMRLDAARTLELFPALARRPFFAALADGVRAAAPDTWPGASGLRAAAPARARALLIGRLTERVASIMGFEPGQLDPAAPLMRLGFDSLMALRMRNAVEQDFGLAFPVPIVLRGASLLEVAAHVAGELGLPQPDQPDVPDVPDQAGESDQADARTSEVDSSGIESSTRDGAGRRPWVPEPDIPIRRILRTGRPGSTPLMLFHASGGTTGVYESLVARLPVDQPVYGLERIEGEPDLVARCRRYLEQITEVAPNGPYLLAGWSLGGVLALETAQQLLAAGAEVDLLMLIDTIVPLAGPDLSHTEVILGRLSRFAEHVRGSYGVDLDLPMRTIAEADEDEQIDIVMERLWTRLPVLGEAALVHQYTSYVDARVGERYRPGPYHGRAVLLRADDPHPLTTALDPRYLRDDLTLGWDAFLSELEVFRVPGDHLSMIDPPHVDVVARRLTEQLAVRAARVGGRR
jgi:phthiocerol/phenolphthiocerol synthesis type-I polyketide synthase D